MINKLNKIIAILTIRNEEMYLHYTLKYLLENNIYFFVIDNSSTDKSLNICKSFKNFIGYKNFPYFGYFDLSALGKYKVSLYNQFKDFSWIINLDADERILPELENETLYETILRIDGGGYDSIQTNELVFLPLNGEFYYMDLDKYIFHYYNFTGNIFQRIFKNIGNITTSICGHQIINNLNLYPNNLNRKHFICLSQNHIIKKYKRKQSSQDNKNGFGQNRLNVPVEKFLFPKENLLKKFNNSFEFNDPKKEHYWQWT